MDVVARRALINETKVVLRKGSELWAPYSCPASGECCQLATTKRSPWLWPSEWEVIAARLRESKRPVPPPRADGGCALLDASGLRCSVYEARPLGCRTFFCGRVQGPATVPSEKTHALMERLQKLNVAHAPDAAPQPIEVWLERQGADVVGET